MCLALNKIYIRGAFDSLIELRVELIKGFSSILETILPKLERFTFKDDYSFSRCDLLQTFISRHPALKALHINANACRFTI